MSIRDASPLRAATIYHHNRVYAQWFGVLEQRLKFVALLLIRPPDPRGRNNYDHDLLSKPGANKHLRPWHVFDVKDLDFFVALLVRRAFQRQGSHCENSTDD